MWLHVPFMDSASAQESGDSTSQCNSSTGTPIELWVSLSGVPTQRPFSWRGWKKRPWIKLLSGTISQPSIANHSATKWISSLPVSHANRSASLENDKAKPMTDGYGPSSLNTLTLFDPQPYSSKTSPDLDAMDSQTSLEILPPSGSMRNGCISQRPTSVPHTNGDDSSSWPTPAAWDASRGPDLARLKREDSGGHDLVTKVSIWPEWSGHRDPKTNKDGQTGMVLNPAFVETLMGLPPHWSVATVSESAETL